MHIRRNKKPRKGGHRTEIALAHNIRVTAADGSSVPKPVILARLGNEDDVGLEEIDDMIAALQRYRATRAREAGLETNAAPPSAPRPPPVPRPTSVAVVAARQLGVRMLVELAWRDMGLHDLFRKVQKQRCRKLPFEQLVLAMIVNRLTDPMSKHACDAWTKDVAWFPEAADWNVDDFYRAMDVLDEHSQDIADHVMATTLARVPEEERRRVLLDTTNLFLAAEMDDAERAEIASWWSAHDRGERERPIEPRPQVVNEPPLRMRGHSKENRHDAPLVTLGLMTTTKGTLLWHDVRPGNASEKAVTRELVTEVLARHPRQELVCVMDAGMAGRPNLAWLAAQSPRVGWLAGVPLRNNTVVDEALARAGRWRKLDRHSVAGAWQARTVDLPASEWVDPGRPERLILVRNPARARRDLRKLERDLEVVRKQLSTNRAPSPKGAAARRLGNANRARLLAWTPKRGGLRLDRGAVKREHQRLGLRAMRTTITDLTVEETIAAYDDLLNVEVQFRTFKSPLRIRPMHHRSTARIRAHAMLVFLAVACAQELSRRTGQRWEAMKEQVRSIDAVQLSLSSGTWWQRTQWGAEVDTLLGKLGVQQVPERWSANAGFQVRRADTVTR
jgi:hypothetical protein